MQSLASLARIDYGNGFIQKLNPKAKMIVLACFSAYSILLDNPTSLGCLLCISLAVVFSARLDSGKVKAMLLMAAAITWGTMFSQGIFYYNEPRTVLWAPFDGLAFYQEGLRHGAIQSMRFSAMIILGLVFCWTTDSAAMFRGLTALKVPFVLAFMTVTAVRFLPTIMDETSQVMLAWRMRRGRFWSPNPFLMVTNWLGIIRPVLINCYRRSNILALSIQSRGFSAGRAPGADSSLRLDTPARLFVLLLALSVILTLAGKILYWLYLAGFCYFSDLRWLYELNRLYL